MTMPDMLKKIHKMIVHASRLGARELTVIVETPKTAIRCILTANFDMRKPNLKWKTYTYHSFLPLENYNKNSSVWKEGFHQHMGI
uniref:Uncharacterized protein n=1 Tax=Glossina palpalis gambiensis TaxID=67801 RepID=A0A1B0AN00_9MUSC